MRECDCKRRADCGAWRAQRKRRCYEGIEETLTLELEHVVAAFAEWQVQAVPMLERVRKGDSRLAGRRIWFQTVAVPNSSHLQAWAKSARRRAQR
mgnify:CR=1 FL=1